MVQTQKPLNPCISINVTRRGAMVYGLGTYTKIIKRNMVRLKNVFIDFNTSVCNAGWDPFKLIGLQKNTCKAKIKIIIKFKNLRF